MPPFARVRGLFTSVLVVPCIAAALIAGCGDDDPVISVGPDGDAGSGGDGATLPDSGSPEVDGPDPAAVIARGKYLVDHVAACGDCHTPRLPTGGPDMTKYLSGVECFIDVNGPAEGGCLHSGNLTNDITGLKNDTDGQIKKMFQDGQRPDGRFLHPVMPTYVFHNFKPEDADAIVAYLRTVPAVTHDVPASDPPFDVVPAAAQPIDLATVPPANGAPENGRYLAMVACLECHTPELPPGSARPIDMTKVFGGNKAFPAASLGLPSPPFPATIYTANITPHATGLAGWTAPDIVRAVKEGKDRANGGLCPPMPAGPMAAFGGLTDQDVQDIAAYIAALPPIDNAVTDGNGSCVAP